MLDYSPLWHSGPENRSLDLNALIMTYADILLSLWSHFISLFTFGLILLYTCITIIFCIPLSLFMLPFVLTIV